MAPRTSTFWRTSLNASEKRAFGFQRLREQKRKRKVSKQKAGIQAKSGPGEELANDEEGTGRGERKHAHPKRHAYALLDLLVRSKHERGLRSFFSFRACPLFTAKTKRKNQRGHKHKLWLTWAHNRLEKTVVVVALPCCCSMMDPKSAKEASYYADRHAPHSAVLRCSGLP